MLTLLVPGVGMGGGTAAVVLPSPKIILTGVAQRNVGIEGRAQRNVAGTGAIQRNVGLTGDRGANAR